MSIRARLGLVVLWVASLAVVAPFARTQVLQTVPSPTPTIVSGSDFGFRIEGTQGATPVGRLVVRRNGQMGRGGVWNWSSEGHREMNRRKTVMIA